MSRSLRIHPRWIDEAKLAVKRNNIPRQKDLAEQVRMSLSTVNSFLNGRPVDYLNFIELCDHLRLDKEKIAIFEEEKSEDRNDDCSVLSSDILVASDLEEATQFIYVERPPLEESCYKTLLQPAALLRIKSPNLMGKTSLIARVLAQIDKQSYRTVYLNLNLADETDFTSLERILKWFCASVGQSLGIPNQLSSYWDTQFSSPKICCKNYFERYLLTQVNTPLVLCLDEIDRVFPYRTLASEFLGMLRAWHEESKTPSFLQGLRLVIAYATDVYIPLNIHESPFNVGTEISLPEFSSEQVQQLARLHQIDWTMNQVTELMNLIGGHPYLVEQALVNFKIQQNLTLDSFLATAATNSGVYRGHLQRIWRTISEQSELVKAIEIIIQVNSPVFLASEQSHQLERLGLIRRYGNQVTTRCNLYRYYFHDRLGVGA